MNRSLFGKTVSTVLLFCSLVVSPIASNDTQITIVRQPVEDQASLFNCRLTFSRASISFFLKKIFNHLKYPQEHLALNLSHISQGIGLAPQHSHSRRFIRKVLNLFCLKLHDIYVNPYAYCTFLEELIELVAPYTDREADKEYTIELFKETIGSYLSEQFDQLRHAPDRTLHDLAGKLYTMAYPSDDQDCTLRELQHTIHYFLTRGIQLLTWSPDDQEDAWHIMMSISSRIERSVSYGLIDHEMADDLYWILVDQFSLFLSVAGPELSSRFYETASSALHCTKETFWHKEERELYITSKFEHLNKALMQAEATSKLQAYGYVAAA